MTFDQTEKTLIDSLQSIENQIEELQSQILRLRSQALHNHVAIKLMADHIGLTSESLDAAVNKLILDTTTRIDLENLFNDDK